MTQDDDLAKITEIVNQKGLKWKAGKTSISGLSYERRKNILLPTLPAWPTAPLEKIPFALPKLPKAYDWRNVDGKNYVTSVKNQVGPTCIAFATTAALESCFLRTLDPYVLSIAPLRDVIDLSEFALVSLNKAYPAVGEFLMSTGLPPETCYPYNAPSPSAGWQLNTVKAEEHYWYKHLPIDDVKSLIVQIGPIVTGMNVTSDFFSYKSGIYSATTGKVEGFHLVLIVGYDDLNNCFIVKNSWGTDWGENGFFRISYSEFENSDAGGAVDFGMLIDAYSGAVLTSPTSVPIALKTNDGHYVTIVNGGGLGGPNTGPQSVAMHTDASVPGPWETFELEWVDPVHFAVKTINGNYVTAVNGGHIGGPNNNTSPVHTDASKAGPWERLLLDYNNVTRTATFRTPDGHYLTAVNGGGFGGPNNVPIHTDATNLGPWETFSLELLK